MVFRVHKNKNYTTMSNYHLRDKKLSLKAKGLLSWMLSNNDDWDYSIAGIVACCKEGETAITSTLKELQEFGYVKITKHMPSIEDNKIHYSYDIYEKPQDIENQVLENQVLENQVQRNTNIRNTNIRNKSISKDIDTDFQFGTKKSKTKKPTLYDKCLRLISDFTDDGVLRELLVSSLRLFVENSREAGTPFYTNTFKGKLNSLKRLSEDNYEQRKIVQQTLDNGWNGFYELKTNNRKTKNVMTDIEHLSGLSERAEKGDISSGEKF